MSSSVFIRHVDEAPLERENPTQTLTGFLLPGPAHWGTVTEKLSSGVSLTIPQALLTLDFSERADHSLRTSYNLIHVTHHESHRVGRGHRHPLPRGSGTGVRTLLWQRVREGTL